MRIFIIILLFLRPTLCQSQMFKSYHEFEPTASSFMILKWNIQENNLPRWYVEETTDSIGRVIELKFYDNGLILKKHLCYLSPWIQFKYPNDTTIIQLLLTSEGNKGGDFECETPWKITYSLSKDHKIILHSYEEYNIDTVLLINNGWSKEKIDKNLDSIRKYKDLPNFIYGYISSYSKLEGMFPIGKSFEKEYLNINSPEGQEIIKALDKN